MNLDYSGNSVRRVIKAQAEMPRYNGEISESWRPSAVGRATRSRGKWRGNSAVKARRSLKRKLESESKYSKHQARRLLSGGEMRLFQ